MINLKHALKTTLVVILVVVAFSTITIIHYSLDRSFTRLRREGNIRIGYAVEAPYAFVKPDGEITGESPEVAKRIVVRLGIPHIQWRQAQFGSLISGLEAGRFDVIASGMFITPERAKRVCFSEPTFHVKEGLLVLKGNPLDLHSYLQPLTLTHIKFAVVFGSVEETLLRRMGLPKRQMVIVPNALSGRLAVESGMADGMALSSPTMQWMALQDQLGGTERVHPFTQAILARKEHLGFGAFAFRKKDHQLQSAWNKAMKGFIGSPAHLELISAFGFTRSELPGTMTTAEVLAPP